MKASLSPPPLRRSAPRLTVGIVAGRDFRGRWDESDNQDDMAGHREHSDQGPGHPDRASGHVGDSPRQLSRIFDNM